MSAAILGLHFITDSLPSGISVSIRIRTSDPSAKGPLELLPTSTESIAASEFLRFTRKVVEVFARYQSRPNSELRDAPPRQAMTILGTRDELQNVILALKFDDIF